MSDKATNWSRRDVVHHVFLRHRMTLDHHIRRCRPDVVDRTGPRWAFLPVSEERIAEILSVYGLLGCKGPIPSGALVDDMVLTMLQFLSCRRVSARCLLPDLGKRPVVLCLLAFGGRHGRRQPNTLHGSCRASIRLVGSTRRG